MTLLERVVVRLSEEFAAERFERMRPFLTLGKGEIPYARAAAEMAMDEGAVRVAEHRMRKRYRQLLREEIGHTLGDPGMEEEELGVLVGVFG